MKLSGSIVALITPMYEDGTVDFLALKKLVTFHIENNTSAIVSVGTTGEAATLNKAEHLEILQKTVAFADGRIPIIAGSGANSTSEAIALTAAAKEIGADYALLITPYYNKPGQEGLYQHYKKIAETVDIGQILYNVPSRTAVNLTAETVVRLSEIDGIIGIKDATGDLLTATQLLEYCPKDFLLFSGDDPSAVSFIALGGHGGISVTANILPKQMSRLYHTALSGDIKEAHRLNAQIAHLHRHLFLESNPIAVKWALHIMGFCQSGIRLPLTPLAEQNRITIAQDLKALSIIS